VRAVVIGGSGQIGGWLLRHLAERGHEGLGTYCTTAFPGLVPLDTARKAEAAAWLRAQRPDVVFYPAGFTWVDGCERDPAKARSSNLDEPLNLARTAAESGARFIYFSTDYVFDGAAGPYDEQCVPAPLSEYGKAKRDAELALASSLGEAHLTIRTCWVYGPERQGKNFAYQLVRTLTKGRTLTCPADQRSSPSYGPDVALAAVLLAESNASGLIHAAGPEVIGRVEFAEKLAQAFGLDHGLIVGKRTSELGQAAPRPLNSGLLTPRLGAWHPGLMRPLKLAVADFQARLANAGEPWANPLHAG
jgi:dTDP-4-dehydrorhamnose reductase